MKVSHSMAHSTQEYLHDGRFERSWVLLEQRDSIEGLQSDVNDALHSCGYGEAASFAIRLALEEALVNGFRHGNKGNPSKHVTVECKIDTQGVELVVIDEGEGS